MKQPELSIVIPTYNEAEIIEDSLKELALFINNYSLDAEVIISDTSSDNTRERAAIGHHLFKRFTYIDAGQRRGKGYNVSKGMSQSRGIYVFFIDADLATPLIHLNTGLDLLKEGWDVVVGIRDFDSFLSPFEAKLASLGTSFMQKTILPGIADTQCGFKGFSARTKKPLFSQQTVWNWGFDIELLYLARKLDFTVRAIQVEDYRQTRVRSKGDDPALKADLELVGAYVRTLLRHGRFKIKPLPIFNTNL